MYSTHIFFTIIARDKSFLFCFLFPRIITPFLYTILNVA